MRLDYPLNNVNTYETVGEFLQKAESRFGDRPAVTVYDWEGKEHCYTYRMLARDAKAIACSWIWVSQGNIWRSQGRTAMSGL